MAWKHLNSPEQLEEINKKSFEHPVLLFKHSTRCNLSADALSGLNEAGINSALDDAYYLDLLAHRDISDKIEQIYEVRHQSPQVLIIHKGKCIYNESHWRIDANKIVTVFEGAAE
jgi:bacillithiol system protein YtxJ